MAVYTRYRVRVTVETPRERRPQLEEAFDRFLKELRGHEFKWSGGRVEEEEETPAPVPVPEPAPAPEPEPEPEPVKHPAPAPPRRPARATPTRGKKKRVA